MMNGNLEWEVGGGGKKVKDFLLLCLAGTVFQGKKTSTDTIVHPQSIQISNPQLNKA